MIFDINLRLAPIIDGPPVPPQSLWQAACASDDVTVKSWENTWLGYTLENHRKFGFKETVNSELGKCNMQPVIIAGSGPSLKRNYVFLKPSESLGADNKTMIQHHGRGDIKIVSCLHNFAFFEDSDIMTKDDYYLTLDSGDITIREVYEGGSNPPEWYWERSKDRTLCCYIGTHPLLLEKWQGKVLWFTTPPQSEKIYKETDKVFPYKNNSIFSVGGNALGACLYMARGVLNCGPTIFIGADFCFSYDSHFHAWNSPYDSMCRGTVDWTDIFGNRVQTWQSYLGFKKYFDFQACGGLGGNGQIFINATEGGILGAYKEGVIKQFLYMDLKTALHTFNIKYRVPDAMKNCKYLF
jgi:hypothetical protein